MEHTLCSACFRHFDPHKIKLIKPEQPCKLRQHLLTVQRRIKIYHSLAALYLHSATRIIIVLFPMCYVFRQSLPSQPVIEIIPRL